MAVIGPSMTEFQFFPDAPPAIVGTLTTGQTVNIELWRDGSGVAVTASGCTEIGDTGSYSWSVGSGITTLSSTREQYHWRMSDGIGGTDDGDFILISSEGNDGGMPSLNDKSSYIVQN